jgi:hypothetical protein
VLLHISGYAIFRGLLLMLIDKRAALEISAGTAVIEFVLIPLFKAANTWFQHWTERIAHRNSSGSSQP